ncbi:MAG: Ig-like domain-containing protein [Bacteroidetes bacterium]|nr:Ig-like domain-containing protein [Bacteroidota bacterium]MBS1630976.1 Ig-like domain-containing protein [Bacteroidota bacterium]
MRKIALITLIIFMAAHVGAQSCTNCSTCENCNKILKIAPFSLNVLVPKPADTGVVLLQWRQLFWLSTFANSKLFELNRDCMYFIQPLVKNEDNEEVLRVGMGESGLVLPENSNPSKYGDYIITGSVSSSGSNYLMHLELQAACSMKKVAAVDVPFNPSSDPEYVKQIAEQAATQLSPLADKINDFIQRERKSDNEFAWGGGNITIKPKKKKLATGEETEIEITMKDCDGYALSNRKINFSRGTISGFAILGTIGGTVTPSIVTTDANGKAKAKFKMGSGKTAMIRAHHLFKKPSGCEGAIYGLQPVNGIPVKVEVEYDLVTEIDSDPASAFLPIIEGGKENSYFTRVFHAVFYYYPSDKPDNMLLLVAPEEKIGVNTVFEKEEGFFFYMKSQKESQAKIFLAGQQVYEEKLTDANSEANYGSVRPGHPSVFAFYKKDEQEPMRFSILFNFKNEEEDNEIGTGSFPSDAGVREGEEGAKIIKKKITDTESPYKTEYIAELNRKLGDVSSVDKLLGTHFKEIREALNYKESGKEHLRIRMLMPY